MQREGCREKKNGTDRSCRQNVKAANQKRLPTEDKAADKRRMMRIDEIGYQHNEKVADILRNKLPTE